MVQSILILGAGAPYDFTDEKDGHRVAGRKFHYIIRDITSSGEAEGFVPITQNLAPAVSKKIKAIPGIYTGSFELKMNKEGKQEIVLKDVDPEGAVAVEL